MTEKPILELRSVTLELEQKTILGDLNIQFMPGRIHAVVGLNGAGKSSLAYLIMGLPGYRDFKGDILVDGVSVKGEGVAERAARGLTLAWQEPARYEGLRTRDFVLAGTREKTDAAFRRSLSMVGLAPDTYADRAVDKTLSGGERKRIELASIIAMRPRVAVLDEPDSGVDVDAIRYIYKIIDSLKKEGTTVILITHSLEVLRKAEDAALICGGKLVAQRGASDVAAYFNSSCRPCDHVGRPEKEDI